MAKVSNRMSHPVGTAVFHVDPHPPSSGFAWIHISFEWLGRRMIDGLSTRVGQIEFSQNATGDFVQFRAQLTGKHQKVGDAQYQ